MQNQEHTLSHQTYLWTVGLTSLTLLIAIVSFNYVVDPYLIHQWDTPAIKRIAAAQQKIRPWGKTYAAMRYKPEVVYLGSSRTEIGLPTQIDLFKGKRVFNLAIPGGMLQNALDMLKHTSFFKEPDIVVWGLDYGALFNLGKGNTDFVPELVATGPEYPYLRVFLNIKRLMSGDITLEAIKLVLGLSEQRCETVLSAYGQKPSSCVVQNMIDESGAGKDFEWVIKAGQYDESRDVTNSYRAIDGALDEHCHLGTVFRFLIHPIHALNELHHDLAWQDMENWKRNLVKIVAKHKQQGCDVRIMDFSGFNPITTEAIPQATGKDTMQYYWESSHYKSEVGEIMLRQLFSDKPQAVSDGFGVELTTDSLEAHLIKQRQARDQYCAGHPKETAFMKLCTAKTALP